MSVSCLTSGQKRMTAVGVVLVMPLVQKKQFQWKLMKKVFFIL